MMLESKLKKVSIVQLCNKRQAATVQTARPLFTRSWKHLFYTSSLFPVLGLVAHQVQRLLYGLTHLWCDVVLLNTARRSVKEAPHSSNCFYRTYLHWKRHKFLTSLDFPRTASEILSQLLIPHPQPVCISDMTSVLYILTYLTSLIHRNMARPFKNAYAKTLLRVWSYVKMWNTLLWFLLPWPTDTSASSRN